MLSTTEIVISVLVVAAVVAIGAIVLGYWQPFGGASGGAEGFMGERSKGRPSIAFQRQNQANSLVNFFPNRIPLYNPVMNGDPDAASKLAAASLAADPGQVALRHAVAGFEKGGAMRGGDDAMVSYMGPDGSPTSAGDLRVSAAETSAAQSSAGWSGPTGPGSRMARAYPADPAGRPITKDGFASGVRNAAVAAEVDQRGQYADAGGPRDPGAKAARDYLMSAAPDVLRRQREWYKNVGPFTQTSMNVDNFDEAVVMSLPRHGVLTTFRSGAPAQLNPLFVTEIDPAMRQTYLHTDLRKRSIAT